MRKYSVLLATSVFLHWATLSRGKHVMFMHTCSTWSHRTGQWPLAEALLEKGHNVTFLSPWGPGGGMSNPKVTEITPPALQDKAKELLENHFDLQYRIYGILPPLFLVFEPLCYMVCEASLSSPEVQEWLRTKPKVDLVIGDMTTECSYPISERLGAKSILYMPTAIFTKHLDAFGIPAEMSSIPDMDVTKRVPLTFFARVQTALLPLWWQLMDRIMHPFYVRLYQKTLGLENVPDVAGIKEKTDLIMINGDYITEYARPFPPNVIKLEGIHIKKRNTKKPLSKEIESFLNTLTEAGKPNRGFFFISFGTVAKASKLPPSYKETFFRGIEAFPEYKFIWRWEGEKPEQYPKNLLLIPWVNQQDLLAHPNIRGFINQAGLPSTQEALYNEVPMITFPILGDQDFNAQRCSDLGYCILADFSDLQRKV